MEEVICCRDLGHSAFFPYRTVIRGSKLFTLPIRDSRGNLCGFSEPRPQPLARCPASTDLSPSRPPCHVSTALPLISNTDHIPLSARVKAALTPTDLDLCYNLVTPLQRLTAHRQATLKQRLHARVNDMEERSRAQAAYPSPTSILGRDGHFLLKAIRTYKRDAQLQRERGQVFDEPKHFPDESTRSWYYKMAGSDGRCLDRDAREFLNLSDCVQFDSACDSASGRTCFTCPERERPLPRPAVQKAKVCDC